MGGDSPGLAVATKTSGMRQSGRSTTWQPRFRALRPLQHQPHQACHVSLLPGAAAHEPPTPERRHGDEGGLPEAPGEDFPQDLYPAA